MNASFLVDSDVLIDALRQVPAATIELERLLQIGRLGVSVVTRMELIVGYQNKQALARAEKLLQTMELLALNKGISDIANGLVTTYSLSHGMQIPDALIGATALYYAIPLLTKNQRDFQFLPGLKLLPYPTAA